MTGLSGSGKSVVAKCFEDLGYYTVDNLPLPLLRMFVDNPLELVRGHDRIAVVTDVRAPGFAEELPAPDGRDRPRQGGGDAPLPRGLGRSAGAAVLRDPAAASAGRATRRSSRGSSASGSVLAELRARADMVFDTSEWSIHEIRTQVYREFAGHPGEEPGMVVSLVSFGFKHGIPYGTDLLFDVRFLSNPHFVPGLREQTGQDAGVQEYLEQQPDFLELLDRLDRSPALPPAALPAGEPQLPLGGGRLHRRTAPLGRHLRAPQGPAGKRGLAGAPDPPRYRAIGQMKPLESTNRGFRLPW